MDPHIALPADDSLPDYIRQRRATFPPWNVFRMLANAPASFDSFLDVATSVLAGREFDARKWEIAALRVAHVTRAEYQWPRPVVCCQWRFQRNPCK